MKRYIKNNQIKTRQEIIIVNNGMRTINPAEEQILADGWVEYTPPVSTISEEQKAKAELVRERHKLRNNIINYDSSLDVNSFYIDDQQIWLDKATRVGLKLRFDAEIASGHTNTTLWYEGTPFNIELANAVQMLNAIELYASACYDNTQMHIAYIKIIEDLETLKNYNYKTGYPEKLRF